MEGKNTIPLLIWRGNEAPERFAGKRNGAAVAETSGVIGIPIPCSPGASDRPSWVVLVR
jgi:hypothetical protein